MTNDEKASQLYDEVECLKGTSYYNHIGTYSDGVYCGALDMAEWKDSQLKQLLSEHMGHATGQRLEAFMDLYRELFEQNAPENPQATRLSTTQPSNIADALSTPRELCMNCYNWVTPEFNDIPHCIENAYDCRAYLLGRHDNCPKHLVL
jgi:hypothetical protein